MAAEPVLPGSTCSGTPEPTPLSEGARMINTFIAPSKTFTDLRRSASWWAPWLLISIVSLAFVYVMGKQIGFDQISKTEISRSSRAEQFEKLPPDKQAQQLDVSTTVTRDISYATPAVILIAYVIMAAVLMATFNFGAGASVPFKVALAIVIYGSLPGVISALLGIISMFAGVDPAGFNVRNPVATNPAYFMDLNANKFLYVMASALDVLVLWSGVLMGIGFSCNSKVKRGSAIAMVLGWYLVYKLAAAGLATLFA